MPEPFGPAHEWCDRRCDRCPLASACAVALRARGRRWAHEMRGRDPDDTDVVLGDVAADLSKAVAVLEQLQDELAEDGAPREPARVVAFAGRQLDERALDVVRAIGALGDEGDELVAVALTLSMKAARVGSYVTHGARDDVWAHDGAPNLLLLDHLRRALRAGLDAVDRATIDRATIDLGEITATLDSFDRALDPLMPRAEPHRAHLDALIAARAAPSPFALRPEPPDDAQQPS